jgi:hypothetical protein
MMKYEQKERLVAMSLSLMESQSVLMRVCESHDT